MAERLSDHAPVLYVDPPVSRLSGYRNPGLAVPPAAQPIVPLTDNLALLRPLVPPRPGRPGMSKLTSALLRRLLRRVSAGPQSVRAVISAWPLYSVVGSCERAVSVFWAQDDFSAAAQAWGLSPARMAREERLRVLEADLVVAANPVVYRRWQRETEAIELIPFGCDTTMFERFEETPPAAGVQLPSPVAVVVGQLNFRVDLGLLEAVVDRGLSLLVVGPVNHPERERMQRLLARPGVQAVGERPISEVPGYLRHADVGLVPYNHNAFNESSFPLKTLEYLAARLPVVSTDLPATRWLDTPLVTIADYPAAFAAAATQAVALTHRPDLRTDRWRFAEQHSYASRAAAMMAAIGRG